LNFGSERLTGQGEVGLLVEISVLKASNGGFHSKFMKNQFTGEKVEIPGNRGLVLENAAGFGASVASRKLAVWLMNWRRKFACSRLAQSFCRKIRKNGKIRKNMAFSSFWRALRMTSA